MASAKIKYILELENKANLKPIIAEVQAAAAGFDGLKSKIEISARSLGLMQRELTTMQGTFTANKARIKDLEQALNLASVSATQDEKANAKLRAELDRLTATNTKLSASMERKSISIQRASANLTELGRQAAGTSQSLQNTAANIDKNTGATNGLLGGITKLAAGYASLAAVTQVVQWAKEGAAIEGVQDSFENLAAKAGTSSSEYLAALKKASAGTISEADLMVGANKAVLLAGDRLAKDVPELLEIARASAKATGQDMNFMFDSLVTGLARNSKMIIDNLGITVDISEANERYAQSIGKSVNALTEQERAMAFQAEVMRQGKDMVDAVGISQDTNADKIARAGAIWTDFTNGLKVGAANVVGFLADGISTMDAMINKQFTLAQRLGEVNYLAVESGKSWEEYRAKLETVGLAEDGLAQNQYQVAQALTASGMSAEQATNQVQDLGTRFFEEAQQANLSAEALTVLVQRQQEVAAVSPEAAGAVQATNDAFAMSTISVDTYRSALETIASETETNTELQTVFTEAINAVTAALEYNRIVTEGGTLALGAMSEEQYNSILAFGEQALAAEIQKDRMEMLNDTVYAVADGSMTLDGAIAYLSQQFNISRAEAEKLIITFTRLASAMRMDKGGAATGAFLDVAGKAVDDLIDKTRNIGENIGKGMDRAVGSGVRQIGRPSGAKKKGGSGGAKGGKSEEVKAAEKEQKDLAKAEKSIESARQNHNKKLEDIDRKHAAELIKINAKYIQDALAAENKFNTDKFAIRNGFKQSLFDIDRDLYDAARAEEVKYWDESQAIAQAGDATKAADLLAAGQELAQMRADHAQQLRDIDAEIANAESADEAARLADRKSRMEEAYAEEQRLAEENIGKIRNGEDTLRSERDEAIADEQRDYDKARSEADAKFQEDIAKIVEGYDVVDQATERTKQAIIDMANAAVAGLASVAGATPPTSVEAVTGRATGGNVRASMPYTVGEFGRELFVPRQSGTILNQRQLDRAMNRGTSPTLATPRSSRTETINRSEVVLNVSGTAREITQAEAVVRRIAREEIDKDAKITVNRVVTRRPR